MIAERGNQLISGPENNEYDTLLKGFENSVKKFPNHSYLGTRDDSQPGRPYVWKTYREVDEITTNLAKGTVKLGLVPEIQAENKNWKFMGIYSKNREEWVLTDIANMKNSVVTIAFYDTLGPASVDFVINQTKLTSISCSSNYLPGLLKLKKEGKAESVKNLVSFEKFDEALKQEGKDLGVNIYTFQEIIDAGKEYSSEVDLVKVTKESIYMFCYTSGTTGDPKAAMLSHSNMVSVACASNYLNVNINENDTTISYLPLAHSFEKCIFSICICNGSRYAFYSGDPLKLLEDLQALQPTIFPSVPRLFNRIYDRIQAGIKEKSKVQQYLFNKALASKLYYLENGAAYTHRFYDKVVFKKIQNLVGGNVRLMITGSAPINGEVLKFLKVCFACPIREGYGQTETSAPATLTANNDPTSGHVGGPLPCIMFRLKDIPEMNYLSSDPNPRGEMCLKGFSIFQGYFKAPDRNAEAFDQDGWLRSGDVAELLPNGAVKIIDRAKNIFKLSQGEYIAPEKLENVYIQSHFLAQIYVHGDSLQSYLVSVGVVEPGVIKKWAKENRNYSQFILIFFVELDESDLSQHMTNEKLNKEILADLNRLAVENKFSGLEKIKQIHLTLDPFTIENDILTPTMKIKRNIARKIFDKEIAEMYAKPIIGA